MSTLKISSYARQGYTVFFTLFLLFSAVFCVSTRTNNLLHLSILLFLLSLLNHDNRQALAESIRQRWLVYILLVVFCVYYALSNIWGQTPQHIDSPLTHGAYLFFLSPAANYPAGRPPNPTSGAAERRCRDHGALHLDDGDRFHPGPQRAPGITG